MPRPPTFAERFLASVKAALPAHDVKALTEAAVAAIIEAHLAGRPDTAAIISDLYIAALAHPFTTASELASTPEVHN